MLVKEFKETLNYTSYEVSGQDYYKDLRGSGDLDEQMNEFFKENPNIKTLDIKYGKCSRNHRLFSKSVEVSQALLLYEEKKTRKIPTKKERDL